MYLTNLFSPETLIIGVFLAPLLDVHVPTLEIVGIGLRPFSLTLPFPLRPACRLPATLLGFPGSPIRPVIPATIDTPLLSAPCRFHTPILTDEAIAEPRGGLSGNKKN